MLLEIYGIDFASGQVERQQVVNQWYIKRLTSLLPL
jgi:hypothetical protein